MAKPYKARQVERENRAAFRLGMPADAGLGAAHDGKFDFTSPQAREAWHRSAYAQGVDPETWHLGDAVDPETERLIGLGLGGAHPPFYRGPDGNARFGNARTMERSELRDIRRRHFAGKSMEEIENAYQPGGILPGADAAVTLLLGRKQPANDLLANDPPANDPGVPPIHLAQAVDIGSQSDAEPPLMPTTPKSEMTDPTAPGLLPTDPVRSVTPSYPSGVQKPSYPGERMVMGPDAEGESGPLTLAALASLSKVTKATFWPVDGTKGADGRPILNTRDSAIGQGDGRYGWTRNGGKKKHAGYDIMAAESDPIRAVKDGTVVYVENGAHESGKDAKLTFGNEIIIQHDDGTYTQYAHMQPTRDLDGTTVLKARDGTDRITVVAGQQVKAGETIGYVGRTGNLPGSETQAHLHFEVRYGNHGRAKNTRTTIHPGYVLP